MRLFYTVLFYLLIPFILLRLYWRGIKAPEYRKRWLERFAFYNKKYQDEVIWVHAVSVGEAEAVFPLVKQLQKKYPSDKILITTTTPTGSARVQAVFANTVVHVYLPYDIPFVVRRFLTVFKPKIAIIMEKELWPNLYAQCAKNSIPLTIINARLSANSAKGYKKISALIKPLLVDIAWIATQTEEDRQRFIEIGAREKYIRTVGNLKFDLELDENIHQQAQQEKNKLFKDRFVWIIASTHDREEDVFFEIYPQLKQRIPDLLLMMVPRHPERFEKVKTLAEKMQLNVCVRSTGQQCSDNTDVYLVDTMGELKLLYGVADICFVGGSMVPVGGHNILEPAAMHVPIMFGPHMVNFKEIARNVLDLNAAIQCADREQVKKTVVDLYIDIEFRNGLTSRADQFVTNNKGATERTVEIITEIIG